MPAPTRPDPSRPRTAGREAGRVAAGLVLALVVQAGSAAPSAARPAAQPAAQPAAASDHGAAAAVPVGVLRIDRHEVSVARFDAFLRATGRTSTAEREGGGFEWGAGWERRPGWTFRAPSGTPARPDDPAAHVSWHEAADFCAWAGGRLPTREEWSLAAYVEQRASPPPPFVAGRTYPYPTGEHASGANLQGAADGFERHAPNGATAAGVNGLHEMAGNVWEWLADARGDERLTAGGSWWYGAAQTRADGMQWKPARFLAVYVGFRCVYPPR